MCRCDKKQKLKHHCHFYSPQFWLKKHPLVLKLWNVYIDCGATTVSTVAYLHVQICFNRLTFLLLSLFCVVYIIKIHLQQWKKIIHFSRMENTFQLFLDSDVSLGPRQCGSVTSMLSLNLFPVPFSSSDTSQYQLLVCIE